MVPKQKGDVMKFTLTMNMNTRLFTVDGEPEMEAARVLRKLSNQVWKRMLVPGSYFILRDFKGNRVGKAEVTE